MATVATSAGVLSRRVQSLSGGRIVFVGIALIPLILLVALLSAMVWTSLIVGTPGTASATYSLQNYVAVYADPLIYSALVNTLIFALSTAVVALAIGTSIAWLVERTTLPGKTAVYTVMTVGLVLPSMFLAMGWVFLLNPKIGMLNTWLRGLVGGEVGPLDIATPVGMGWVEGLALAPVAFIMTAETFRAMDSSIEEAAEVHGLRYRSVMRCITLPLTRPGLLAAFIYVFVIGFAAFDVPALIGLGNRVYTVSTYLFLQTNPPNGLPSSGLAAALGSSLFVLAILLTVWYGSILRHGNRYQIVTGKGYRPRQIDLGRWSALALAFIAAYALLALVVPLLMVVWVSLTPFLVVPSAQALEMVTLKNYAQMPWPLVGRSITHTLLLMAVVPVAAIAASVCITWLVIRGRTRLRYLLDFAAFLPHTMPSVVLAVGGALLALFVLRDALPLYGTVWLIAVVYTVMRLPFATRVFNTALLQIHAELEEAAHVSGLSVLASVRHVMLPLLLPALVSVWLWSALLTYRELTVATFLSTPNNVTLPVVVWGFWYAGHLGNAAAITVILVAVLLPLIGVYWVCSRRTVGSV